MLACDVGEPAGDIAAAGEDHSFGLCPDRGQHRAGPVAAIEQRGEPGAGDGLACGSDERSEPAGAGVNSGIGGAGEDQGLIEACGGLQRADRVRERVDDDNRVGWLPLTPTLCRASGARGRVSRLSDRL